MAANAWSITASVLGRVCPVVDFERSLASLPVFAGGRLLALSHRCPLLLLPVIPQLIREGFWLGGSTVVSAEGSPGKVRALLIAVQNEPAMLVYGAIAFLLLVGFALLIPTSKWKKWVTGH